MPEELKVDLVINIKDVGTDEVQAKVKKLERYKVSFVTRSNPRGRWGTKQTTVSRQKFWKMIRAVA